MCIYMVGRWPSLPLSAGKVGYDGEAAERGPNL